MSKYKVGDKVKIRSNLVSGMTSDGFMVQPEMSSLAGSCAEVIRTWDAPNGSSRYSISKSTWSWRDDCFSGLANPEPKFNVGDEVVGNEKADMYGCTVRGWKGKVTKVGKNGFSALGHGNESDNSEFWCLSYDRFDLAKPSSKILITTDGTTTTARLYENEKVVKSAQAKCAPGDAFDFAIGAGLVYGRLMYGGEAFKAEKVEADKPKRKEPIKLYCIEDCEPGEWITKGKIYELDDDGTIHFDDGYKLNYPEAKKRSPHSHISTCLIPLTKRPAKVGEWIYLVSEPKCTYKCAYHKGEILKVISFGIMPSVRSLSGVNWTGFYDDEYLVLDGYAPKDDTKPEPAKIDMVCPCCGVRIVQDAKGEANENH